MNKYNASCLCEKIRFDITIPNKYSRKLIEVARFLVCYIADLEDTNDQTYLPKLTVREVIKESCLHHKAAV